jgi:hypothetical protein
VVGIVLKWFITDTLGSRALIFGDGPDLDAMSVFLVLVIFVLALATWIVVCARMQGIRVACAVFE